MGNAAEAAMDAATQALEAGDTQQALSHINKAIMLAPENPKALIFRGMVLHNEKRYEDALADFDAILQRQGPHPPALAAKGASLKQLGRFDLALEAFDAAIQLQPMPFYFLQKSEALVQMGQPNEGVEAAELGVKFALEENNRDVAVTGLKFIAQTFRNSGQPENQAAAEKVLAMAAKVARGERVEFSLSQSGGGSSGNPRTGPQHPPEAKAAYTAGKQAVTDHNFQASLPHLEHAVKLAPDNVDCRLYRGLAYLGLQRYEEALSDAEFVLQRDPKDVGALVLRVGLLRELGRLEEALVEVRAAIDEFPNFAALKIEFAKIIRDAFGEKSKKTHGSFEKATAYAFMNDDWVFASSGLVGLIKYCEACGKKGKAAKYRRMLDLLESGHHRAARAEFVKTLGGFSFGKVAVLLLLIAGLFFGGRWVYGKFTSPSSEPNPQATRQVATSDSLVKKADAAMAEKRFADAAGTYERAMKTLKTEGGSGTDVLKLKEKAAKAHYKAKDYDTAIKHYTYLASQDPKHKSILATIKAEAKSAKK